ncbi:hypothetical protein G210_5539, partial [Candida maltosa Xu316]
DTYMPFFKSSKKDNNSLLSPVEKTRSNRSNSINSIDSYSSSIHSTSSSTTSRLKSFFKSNSTPAGIDSELYKLNLNHTPSPTVIPTIIESDSFEEESGDESDCEEEHLHPIKLRNKYIESYFSDKETGNAINALNHFSSALFGALNKKIKDHNDLKKLSILESHNTYSLLNDDYKISRISKSWDGKSVIGVAQLELIKNLTGKINRLLSLKTFNVGELFGDQKSMYYKYGTVKKVIGKGAYGLIKIIDPVNSTESIDGIKLNLNKKLYAIKQWFPKNHESNDKFIERILSEFIIQSSLNNKHVTHTIDLLCTLPVSSDDRLKFSQVMTYHKGSDLYTYLINPFDVKNRKINYLSLDELDCWIKQISMGLDYMHNHGVSHCDLKLENILINYHHSQELNGKAKMILKIADFGKSFVFRTKFDYGEDEQYLTDLIHPIGTKPYIPPEEYHSVQTNNHPISSIMKDCWSLGILILVLFNIRKKYYSGKNAIEGYITDDKIHDLSDTNDNNTTTDNVFVWESTELKNIPKKQYKDRMFGEYVQNRLISEYDSKTKEWLITQKSNFKPIDELFNLPKLNDDDDSDDDEGCEDDYYNEVRYDDFDDELNELRIMIIYKLLDIDPCTRMTTSQLLSSDWMKSVDICN